jgi:tRNA G18 (ribose-2'-O)-methylase SpoU
MKETGRFRILAHDIRSAHNIGSMLRTSDAFGVERFHISGFSPAPLDRFERPVKEIAKTALGAESSVPWERDPDPLSVIAALREEGFVIVGLEQDDRAVDYRDFVPSGPILLLVGSEVEGLSAELRGVCDVLIEIPMLGTKESLNVSVAFGIALSRLTLG